ncbi:MAG: D-alanyl-D-alanine carboxypeptidase family protein [Alphaproteobacteria bacterium]
MHLFYILFLFFTFNFSASASSLPDALAANAKEAILINLNTDTVLYAKNADLPTNPSSMTKIMQVYLIFERLKQGRLKMEDTFSVSPKAWKTEGSRMFLPVHSQVSLKDLLLGIVVQSGNDASVALAEGIGGTEENFAREMTETARKLGATKSNFVNATGLSGPRHTSTVRDLATISKNLIQNFPDYYHLFSEKFFKFNKIKQPNRNALLFIPGLGCDGIKTGHTDEGGYGIVASAQQNGQRLLLVINGTESEIERKKVAEDLLNWGFREFENTLVLKANTSIATPKVSMGTQSRIPVGSLTDLYATLPRGTYKNFKLRAIYKSIPLKAPIKKGSRVGTLQVYTPQGAVADLPLIALEDSEEAGFLRKIWLKVYETIAG